MGQERLNMLAVLSIHKDVIADISRFSQKVVGSLQYRKVDEGSSLIHFLNNSSDELARSTLSNSNNSIATAIKTGKLKENSVFKVTLK
jgi:hypothetical protein